SGITAVIVTPSSSWTVKRSRRRNATSRPRRMRPAMSAFGPTIRLLLTSPGRAVPASTHSRGRTGLCRSSTDTAVTSATSCRTSALLGLFCLECVLAALPGLDDGADLLGGHSALEHFALELEIKPGQADLPPAH